MSRPWCVVQVAENLDDEEQYRLWEAVDIWADNERGLTFLESFEHMLATQRKTEYLQPMRVDAADNWDETKIAAAVSKALRQVNWSVASVLIGSDENPSGTTYSHDRLWPHV